MRPESSAPTDSPSLPGSVLHSKDAQFALRGARTPACRVETHLDAFFGKKGKRGQTGLVACRDGIVSTMEGGF